MIGGAREPRADVPLAPLSTLGVGGPARWYAHATSVQQVQAAPPVAPAAENAAQQASARVQETPAAAQTPPQAAADPIGDLVDETTAPTPAQ